MWPALLIFLSNIIPNKKSFTMRSFAKAWSLSMPCLTACVCLSVTPMMDVKTTECRISPIVALTNPKCRLVGNIQILEKFERDHS